MPSADPHLKDTTRYYKRKAAGICVQHGCNRAPENGRVYCYPCSHKRAMIRARSDDIEEKGQIDTGSLGTMVERDRWTTKKSRGKPKFVGRAFIKESWVEVCRCHTALEAKAFLQTYAQENSMKFDAKRFKLSLFGKGPIGGLFD